MANEFLSIVKINLIFFEIIFLFLVLVTLSDPLRNSAFHQIRRSIQGIVKGASPKKNVLIIFLKKVWSIKSSLVIVLYLRTAMISYAH